MADRLRRSLERLAVLELGPAFGGLEVDGATAREQPPPACPPTSVFGLGEGGGLASLAEAHHDPPRRAPRGGLGHEGEMVEPVEGPAVCQLEAGLPGAVEFLVVITVLGRGQPSVAERSRVVQYVP